jgi:hypothetical protein
LFELAKICVCLGYTNIFSHFASKLQLSRL